MFINLPASNEELSVKYLAYEVARIFHYSSYPRRAYDVLFTEGNDNEVVGELQIRIPTLSPGKLRNDAIYQHNKLIAGPLCEGASRTSYHLVTPAIASLELPERLQRKGFLGMLVYCLAKMHTTRYVVITGVGDESFEEYLMKSNLWEEDDEDQNSYLLPLFYVSSEKYISKQGHKYEESWRMIDEIVTNTADPDYILIKTENGDGARKTTTLPVSN